MSVSIAAVLVLILSCQAPQTDRALAEQLARSGKTVEALAMFERLRVQNPADIDVRLWIAAMHLRLGHTAEAEKTFRAVVADQPSHVDARIGLGAALTRLDEWREALAVLRETEPMAGENADLFAALARAYRRSGDDRRALAYYKRAIAIAPADPDLREAFEATVRAYGHSIEVEGFAEGGASDAQDLSVTGTVRVLPRLALDGIARVQNRNGATDSVFGGGGIFRVNRTTNFQFRAGGGANNTSLANGDVTAEVRTYRGPFELGFNYRYLAFTGVDVNSFSPIFAWQTGNWRLAARYTYTWSAYQTINRSDADHSALLRETYRISHRVDTTMTYAYGIESFEDLTADRIANLGGHTIAGSVRFRMRSLTALAATWEHQWRSNDTEIDRLTLLFVQRFR